MLEHPIEGINLSSATLQDELGTGPTLVVFLRHLGCIFCREMVRDVRSAIEADSAYPPVLFFYQGTVADGREFFARYFPGARAVADLDRKFYAAAGVRQAPVVQLLSPRLMISAVRATVKGNTQRIGRVTGDPMTMPAVMVFQHGQIIWQHEFKHAGDHPQFATIPEIIRRAASPETPH